MTMHVGDWGTIFQATLKKEDDTVLDVSTASVVELIFERKKGDVLVVDATLVTDGVDGLVQYTFQDGDVTLKGKWKVQGHVVFANGEWRSDLGILTVEENITIPAPAP